MTSSRSSWSSASPSVPGSSGSPFGDPRRVHLEQRLLDRVGQHHALYDPVEPSRDHRRAVYNVYSLPEGTTTCANDGTELYQRPDDKEDVIGKRLEVYERQTRPLVEHYSKLGLLRAIAGEGELDDVFERMEAAALAKPVPAAKVKVQRARAAAEPYVAQKAETPRKTAVVKPSGAKTMTKTARGVKKSAKSAKRGSKAKVPAKSKSKSKSKSKVGLKAKARKPAPTRKSSAKASTKVKAKVKAKKAPTKRKSAPRGKK